MNKAAATLLMSILLRSVNLQAQPSDILDAAELQIALQKLNVLGSVLYLAAHPDDENTAALAYFSKGRKYRTAYLSLTRGDGGQNLIGPEKGAEIGIIRTQELMAARRFDKAEQFFTRAIDFGYSKTAEETFQFWGRDEILADMVWIIRDYRPDVIITRFLPDRYGDHGHHTASAVLAKEAFQSAGDPNRFPDQLKYVRPWQAKRLYWNNWRPGEEEARNMQKIDVGAYNPLLGESYTEIAAKSRSMHKSQGFGATGRRGTRYEYFELLEGDPAAADIFDGIDTSWKRVPGGQRVGELLEDIIESFDPEHPSRSVPNLINVYAELTAIENSHWVRIKKQELLCVIQSCAGLWMEAMADDFAATPGDAVPIKTTVINRSDRAFKLEKLGLLGISADSTIDIQLRNNEPVTVESTIRIPEDYPISQPYWLRESPRKGLFSTRDQRLIGMAENPPSISVKIHLTLNGNRLEYAVPLLFRWTDRVDGELYRQFEIRPRVTLELEDKVSIFADNNPKEIQVKLKSHSPDARGSIRLNGTADWQIKPTSIPFSFSSKFEEKQVVFHVMPPERAGEAVLTAEAHIDGKAYDRALVEISHPHIKRQVFFPESRMKVVKLDIKKPDRRIGYIMGTGDEVPEGLKTLGYDIFLLTDETLEGEDLSRFDVLITGIRAYNTRERLKYTQPRLLEFVNNGGTLIVQYNVSRGLQTETIGPYPFTLGRDRVSDETAPVSFLNPNHQLLNYPNKITLEDFRGWVQERGLYFAAEWDDHYEPILSAHDPNETENQGGLLFARYGKGVFIYTGYSWFRQLPAGVPGAFRLFVNLISAGKANDEIAR